MLPKQCTEIARQTEFDSAARPCCAPSAKNSSVRMRWLALWMTGALLSFSAGALSVRVLSKSNSVFEIMFFRSGSGLLVLLILAVLRPKLRQCLAPHQIKLHGLRSCTHYVAQICWALAITKLPLATVFAIEFTMPAWVVLLAVRFLGERMTPSRVGSVAFCILGVLTIVRPGFAGFQWQALLVVVSAMTMGITAVCTKKLTATQSTFAILFWMNVMQLPINVIASNPSWILNIQSSMLLPLMGMTVTGLSTHWCLSNAFRYGDASVVVPLDFLRVPLIALLGWSLYGEQVDEFVCAGTGLIIAGVLWNLRTQAHQVESGEQKPPRTLLDGSGSYSNRA
jgi:drug/metabolite transporter (DMT)-like permease